jgi:hypothetical protein
VAVAAAAGAAAVVVAAAAAAGGDPMRKQPPSLSRTTLMKMHTLHAALAAALFATLSPVAWAADAPAKQPAAKPAAVKQASFATPEDAAKALYDVMKGEDVRKIYAILGPGSGALIYTGDKVADNRTRDLFVGAYDKSVKWDKQGDDKATLLLGPNDYPFPFPLVKRASGWMFDAHAGAEEIVNRRIGENEISAIQSCLAVVDAQREYVLKDRDKNGLLEYATKFASSPGKQDGLYWPTAAGEPPSPLGPLYAEATKQGYGERPEAYHGYKFKMLTAQGKDAPGGAYNYFVNGRMIGGFGVVAWPARWGVSGVMTFICNYDGVVFQKDLGADTATIASKMTTYNPDKSWSKTAP